MPSLAMTHALAKAEQGLGSSPSRFKSGSGPDMLEGLIDEELEAVKRRRRELPLDELRSRIRVGERRPFREALARPGMSLIAEFKRRSPTKGEIAPGANVQDRVAAYERGGAAALSVLVQESQFGGALEHVSEARAASDLPILFKTFIVDPSQIFEAADAGADAVLLMVSVTDHLDDLSLSEVSSLAQGLDLDCLVEVRDEGELEQALDLPDAVIGINNREFKGPWMENVDLHVTESLMKRFPTAGRTVVSESGISSRTEVRRLSDIGVDAVLIGEALMESGDPEAAISELLAGEEPTSEHHL
jgi:indole-3-glycerol phosphate synthase